MRPCIRKHFHGYIKCAPAYASIFMGIFEETHIYPLIKQKVQLYIRYIDDIFLMWTSSENELQQFISKSMRYTPPLSLISTTQKPKYIS